jgi:hypothetical protein
MIAAKAMIETTTLDLILMVPSEEKKQNQIHVTVAGDRSIRVSNASLPWWRRERLTL